MRIILDVPSFETNGSTASGGCLILCLFAMYKFLCFSFFGIEFRLRSIVASKVDRLLFLLKIVFLWLSF
jgi:hypothetical protein